VTASPEAGVVLTVEGRAGRTNVVESSPDLLHWSPISTNVMPFTFYPACPFVNVTVPGATAADSLCWFYRAFELP